MKTIPLIACAVALFAHGAAAQSIITDNFNAGGTGTSTDLNVNDGARQTGSAAPMTWTGTKQGTGSYAINQTLGTLVLTGSDASNASMQAYTPDLKSYSTSQSISFSMDMSNNSFMSYSYLTIGSLNGQDMANCYTVRLVKTGQISLFYGTTAVESFGVSTFNPAAPLNIQLSYSTSSYDVASSMNLTLNINGTQIFTYTGSGITGDVISIGGTFTNSSGAPGSTISIDNFDVENTAAVPEPATVALTLGGLAMVGLLASRRSRMALDLPS